VIDEGYTETDKKESRENKKPEKEKAKSKKRPGKLIKIV